MPQIRCNNSGDTAALRPSLPSRKRQTKASGAMPTLISSTWLEVVLCVCLSLYHYLAFWPRNGNTHIPHGNRVAHCHHPSHLSVALKRPLHAAQIHSIFFSWPQMKKAPEKGPINPHVASCWSAGNPRKIKAKE